MLSSAVEISASDKQAKSSQMKRDRTGLSVKRIIENEKFDNSAPLKVDEKKTLSANMNKLPCKKLGKIVEIIHARHPTVLRCVFLQHSQFSHLPTLCNAIIYFTSNISFSGKARPILMK